MILSKLFDKIYRFFVEEENTISNQKHKYMTLQKFASQVAKAEGKKSQVSIGNVREILKIINTLTGGELYKWIRKLK